MFKLNTNLCFSFDFLFCMLTLSCLEFLDNSYTNLKLSVIESLQGYPGHPAWRSHHERHDRGQHGRGQGQQGGRQVPVLTQFCLFLRELMFCFQLGIVVALFFVMPPRRCTLSFTQWSYTVHQDHCGRCRIRTWDRCLSSPARLPWATTCSSFIPLMPAKKLCPILGTRNLIFFNIHLLSKFLPRKLSCLCFFKDTRVMAHLRPTVPLLQYRAWVP